MTKKKWKLCSVSATCEEDSMNKEGRLVMCLLDHGMDELYKRGCSRLTFPMSTVSRYHLTLA